MDPFSAASGIAGLLSLSIELAKIIGGYVDGVKNCSRGVKDLSEKLETLNQVLKQLSDFLRTENSKGASFDQTSTLCFATNACKEKLQSISDNLEKHTQGGRFSKCVEKLKWPFTEAENLQAIETLHGYIQTFHFSLTIEGCDLLSKTSDKVSKALTKQLETHDIAAETLEQISAVFKTIATFSDVSQKLSDISLTVVAVDRNLQGSEQKKKIEEMQKHRETVLEWLSPLTFNDRHHAISALRQPNTGLWFFDTEEFKEWLGGDTNPVLWCPGIPGAGKSVIMSSTVDYLAVSCFGQNTGLAYLYCDYKDPSIQTSVNLISSFTRQLAGKLSPLPSEIEDLYERHRHVYPLRPTVTDPPTVTDRPTVTDHLALLLSLSQGFTKTFLLVDALDEGPNNDGFMDWKLLLSTVQEAGSSIKLLVTSRIQDGIEQIFRTSPRVDIRASTGDVRNYILSRIAKNSSLAGFTTSYPNLQEEIITTVSDKVDGMFLLARFQLDHLGNQTSARNVRKALRNMPEKLTDTYNDTLSRIRAQCKERSELAIRVLSWIYHARRPLQAEELRHALAVEPGDDHLHEDGLQSVELLLGVCGGLVSLDEESGTIRLVHYTIQEYLTSIHDRLFPEPEFDITRTCLTYLLFATFAGTFGDSFDSGQIKGVAPYPFFLYASQNWIHHLRGKHESKLLDLTLKYINHQGMITTTMKRHPAVCFPIFTTEFTPLHFAAGAGLESVVRVLVEEGADIDTLDSNSESPLFWALRNGHGPAFQFLVDKGASIVVLSEDHTVRDIMTLLARGNQPDLPAAKMLCMRVLDNSAGPQQNVLLHPFVLAQALEGGKEAVMKMFLDKGLTKNEVATPCVFPGTIKHWSDHLVCLNLAGVIEINIRINNNSFDSTPIIQAVILKDVPVVLQKFADTAIRKRQGGTIIGLANKQGCGGAPTPPPGDMGLHSSSQAGKAPCAENEPAPATSPNPTPENPSTKQSCTVEDTMLPSMPQGPNITVTPGNMSLHSSSQSGKRPCAESEPASTTSPNTTPGDSSTKKPCIAEDTTLPSTSQRSNTIAPPGKPNQGQLSRGLTRTHYISLILGLSLLICFFLFLNLRRVSFLYNIYFPF